MSDNPYPLKKCLDGILDCLRTAESLEGKLVAAYPYNALQVASPEPGKCVICCLIDDSGSDIEIVDSFMSQTIETSIVIIADTILNEDSQVFDPTSGSSLLDYEWAILQALRSKPYLGTGDQPNNYCLVWRVQSIERDVPILADTGEVDIATPIRRIQITLRVKHRIW